MLPLCRDKDQFENEYKIMDIYLYKLNTIHSINDELNDKSSS